MTTDIKELVQRLRSAAQAQAAGGGWTDPCAVENTIDWNAADALEAMAGEVAFVKAQLAGTNKNIAGWLQARDDAMKRAEAAERERDRLAGEVARLKDRLRIANGVLAETTQKALELQTERDRLKAALETIAHDNVPREVFIVWRTDGSNSKHDKCQHMRVMYDDCGNCISDFARKALEGNA